MAKVQLRLYVETTDSDSIHERQLLMYLQDQFNDEYDAFAGDVEADGNEVLIHQSRIEHGW
jgi:hypothetical protein